MIINWIPAATSFRDEIIAFFDKPQIHQTTLIILICIGIFGVLSTFLLVVWRLKWSGLSGEWVLNDDYARKQAHIAAFDNDCFSMDSKTNHSCSYNLRDKKCPPFEHEMMELVEKSFRGDSNRI
uniref:Uncharacterized protein n=1 Tax=Romanomermis culicivorax TaxID=13658 RepID=A0A915IKR8_ROMCU